MHQQVQQGFQPEQLGRLRRKTPFYADHSKLSRIPEAFGFRVIHALSAPVGSSDGVGIRGARGAARAHHGCARAGLDVSRLAGPPANQRVGMWPGWEALVATGGCRLTPWPTVFGPAGCPPPYRPRRCPSSWAAATSWRRRRRAVARRARLRCRFYRLCMRRWFPSSGGGSAAGTCLPSGGR